MTDQKRSRRPATTRTVRPRSKGTSGSGSVGDLLQLAPDAEPALGEVSFDEWFQTPVFDSDPDELLEELAMTRKGPVRLAASTFLRFNARASQVRRRTGFEDDGAVPAGPPPAPEPPVGPPVVAAEPAEVRAIGRAATAAAAPEGAGPAVAEESGPAGTPIPDSFRQRINAALDRWAEREAATQARLERLILPRRWQA